MRNIHKKTYPILGQLIAALIICGESASGNCTILESQTSVEKGFENLSGMPGYKDAPRVKGLGNSQFWEPAESMAYDCHLLLLSSAGISDTTSTPRNSTRLQTLLDEDAAVAVYGHSPFIQTRHGLRYKLIGDPVFDSIIGEAHRDQCLATFAALHLSRSVLVKAGGKNFAIDSLVSESIASFDVDAKELAWTACSYLEYVAPARNWKNRFGETFTFSSLVERFLATDIRTQSCAGTHVFDALVKIYLKDQISPILESPAREKLVSYIDETLIEIASFQLPDGHWGWRWCKMAPGIGPVTIQSELLITGHLLQTLNLLKGNQRPSRHVYVGAASWLSRTLADDQINAVRVGVCPITHAAIALKGAAEVQPIALSENLDSAQQSVLAVKKTK